MYCNTDTKNRAIAVASVVILLAVALSCCVGSVSAVNDTTHDVEMRVGDDFEYTPTTNLDNTVISISGTATSWLSLDSGTIKGTAETAGDYTLVVTATWTSPNNSSYTQTSTQTISITVYDRISLDSTTETIVYVLGIDTGKIEYTLDYDGPAGTTVTSTSAATWLTCNGATVSGTPTASGTYTVTFDLSFTGALGSATDSASFTLYIVVSDNIAVTSDLEDSTYTGASYTYTVTTNASTIGATGVTYSISSVTVNGTATTATAAGISINSSTGVISGTFGAVAKEKYDTYVITIGASGTVASNGVSETVSTTADLTVDVYTKLAFTSEPTIDKVVVTPDETNSAVTNLKITTSGATSITVEWGDGSYTTATTDEEIAELVNGLDHAYSADGIYTITITAENDSGSIVSTILYDSTDGSWIETAGDAASDYSLVLVLLIVAVLCVLIGFFRWPQAYFVAIALIVIIVALLLCGVTGFEDL